MFRKFLSVTLAATLSLSAFCGCEEENQSSVIKPSYGLLKHVEKEEIYLMYDGNYVSDEEMDAVADYFEALQKCDTELFRKTQPKPYIAYLEQKEGKDISTHINEQNKATASALGEGFDYTEIEVTDCGDVTRDNGINDIKELLDGIYSEMGEKKTFSETVKEAKFIIANISASGSDGGTYNLTDNIIYIFNCEDGIYIL